MSVYGAILFAMSATVFAIGQEKWNYFAGMLLLGIAWNFSFSAGTVMLTESYLPHEATDVQAANDFILFTIAGKRLICPSTVPSCNIFIECGM